MLLTYDPAMARYRFSPSHPMQPERFTLAVELLRAWDLVSDNGPGPQPRIEIRLPAPASDTDIGLAHSAEFIEVVKRASAKPDAVSDRGIGPGDTPAFAGMHEAAALAVGGTVAALESVLDGDHRRAANLSGGLHHAMRERASGFCIYNDAVVAIERARRSRPALRVAYVDIDAHHGDGVEAAFAAQPGVLTISIHESGTYLFPGTGAATDCGTGSGAGSALNIPLPPNAGPECYRIAWAAAMLPALEVFEPDVIVLQAGADSHARDPLTHLRQTVRGFVDMVAAVKQAADALCSGRLVLLGGGGYLPFDEVPRMWAAATATVAGLAVPDSVPTAWLDSARLAAESFTESGPESAGTFAEAHDYDDRRAVTLTGTAQSVRVALETNPLFLRSAVGSVASLKEQLADLVDREIDAGT